MRLHRRHDDALRQREKALVERAVEHDRALDEVDDLLEHAGRVAPRSDRVETLVDEAPPLVGIRLDTGRTKPFGVSLRALYLDFAGVAEPMPVRRASAGNPGEGNRHGFTVELGAEPPDGSREAQIRRPPAHGFPEAQATHDAGEPVRQDLGQRNARHTPPDVPVPALEIRRLDTEAACEPLPRLRRRAVLVEGGAFGRAPALLVGRPVGHAFHDERQPSRPDEERRRIGGKLAAAQLRQLLRGLAAGGSGQLLAADLKQQRGHRPPSPARLPRPRAPRRAVRPGAPAPVRGRCTTPARSRRSRRARPAD